MSCQQQAYNNSAMAARLRGVQGPIGPLVPVATVGNAPTMSTTAANNTNYQSGLTGQCFFAVHLIYQYICYILYTYI